MYDFCQENIMKLCTKCWVAKDLPNGFYGKIKHTLRIQLCPKKGMNPTNPIVRMGLGPSILL